MVMPMSAIGSISQSVHTEADDIHTISDADAEESIAHIAHKLTIDTRRTADVFPELVSPITSDDTRQADTKKSFEGDVTKLSAKPPFSNRFSDMQLPKPLLTSLTDAGFLRPSPVQQKAIPLGRMGLDLIVQAKSGTGKTVVFVVVCLESVDVKRPCLQTLVLSPTREIALQSLTVFRRLGTYLDGLNCQLFVGGLPTADDIRHLSGCHIAVGTPGRVRYLIETGYLQTEHIRYLVLDEADLLLAGGSEAHLTGGSSNNAFPADVNYIWWSLSQTKQVLALSATYTDYLVHEHLHRYMNNPVLVRMTSEDPALLGVRQFFSVITPQSGRSPAAIFSAKVAFLCQLLSSLEFQQCLIFSNFHSSAQDLCEALHSRGWPVSYISSNLDQTERFRAFNRLRAFHCRVLVSTDLTSRGIDAENVNLVISLEVPWEREIYMHRVGRAGRFGSYGASILIVSDKPDELNLLTRLQSRCPTKICQLPNPVPADLATPDCSVDLDSLVTVVNSTSIYSAQQVNSIPSRSKQRRSKQSDYQSALGSYNTVPPDQKKNEVTTSYFDPINSDPAQALVNSSSLKMCKIDKETALTPLSKSSFPSLLVNYLHLVQSEAGYLDSSDITVNPFIDVESHLLLNIDRFLDNSLIRSAELNSTVDTKSTPPSNGFQQNRCSLTHERGSFPPPIKDEPKYANCSTPSDQPNVMIDSNHVGLSSISYRTNHHNSSHAKAKLISEWQWSKHDTMAWYEYQKLVDYAHWYRAAWQTAYEEYAAVIEELEKY